MYADLRKCDDEVQEFIAKHSVADLLDKKIRGEVNKLCLENNCTSETMFEQTKVVDDIESFNDFKKILKKLNEGE